MGTRRKAAGNHRLADFWRAQDKRCGVCGGAMTPLMVDDPELGWSIEHVWARSRYRYRHAGNIILSHTGCNNRKGSRDPTGCELIMLELVNARLGYQLEEIPPASWADPISAPSALALALAQANVLAERGEGR